MSSAIGGGVYFGRGYFGANYFGLGYFGPAGSASKDLIEAAWLWLATDSTLLGLFSRNDWLWVNEAPRDEAMPYAVITWDQSDLSYESPADDDLVPTIEEVQLRISVFSESRSSSRSLGRAIQESLIDANLTFEEGYLMVIRPAGATDTLDPDRGPAGNDVWQRVVQFTASVGRNEEH